jgi:hypothetical protein
MIYVFRNESKNFDPAGGRHGSTELPVWNVTDRRGATSPALDMNKRSPAQGGPTRG